MQTTIFDTPVIRSILPPIGKTCLKLAGWQIEGGFPDIPKYVLIAAPHTSNWDFPVGIGFCFAERQKLFWMGKHTLFAGLLGPVSRWLGGIAVDRRQTNSLVDQMVQVFAREEKLVLAIPPEGTRSKVEKWKTGFYHIAQGAGIPIVLGYIDFARKRAGCMEVFHPSGNADADIAYIRSRYASVTGKHPDKQ